MCGGGEWGGGAQGVAGNPGHRAALNQPFPWEPLGSVFSQLSNQSGGDAPASDSTSRPAARTRIPQTLGGMGGGGG